MDRIELDGDLGPVSSFALDVALDRVTRVLRPSVVVDLSATRDIHPSVASVLIRRRRQARRQGGDLVVVAPNTDAARRTLDQVGIVPLSPVSS